MRAEARQSEVGSLLKSMKQAFQVVIASYFTSEAISGFLATMLGIASSR
jgi:hypothetical protein